MTDFSTNEQTFTPIRAFADTSNNYKIFADKLTSFNFDGYIEKTLLQKQAFEIVEGDNISISDPFYGVEQYLVTRIDRETQEDGSVRHYIYVFSQENIETPFTINATLNEDDGRYYHTDSFFVYSVSDDEDKIKLGTSGWALTREGNAIFSNVFVRGKIEATSGKIDGLLHIGEDLGGLPIVTVGKDIFNGYEFESNSSEHNGLFINTNNYLLAYAKETEIDITRVDVENSTTTQEEYYVELTLGVHSLRASDLIDVNGFDEDIYPGFNGVKVISSVTSTTVKFAVQTLLESYSNPISANLIVSSSGLENTVQCNAFNYSIVSLPSVNTSNVKIYMNSSYISSLEQYDVLELSGFTNPDLLSLNGYFHVKSKNTTYVTGSVDRITAGTNITSGLGKAIENNLHSKFKVGSDNHYMKYSSETDVLNVTGNITASTLNVGGSNGITYDGTTVNIGTDVNIEGGLTTDSLSVGNSPNQVNISNTAVSGNPGIFISGSSDYIRNTGAFRLGGSNGISYTGSGNVAIGTGATFAGSLSAATGTFNGSIQIGSGESVFKADSNGIYLGNETFASAEFRVTPAGVLTATGADITGAIKATSGEFTGNVQIKSGGNLFLGTAIDSGSRVVLSSTNLTAYNSSGVEAFYLPTNGDTPRITNFNILNAKVTGDGPNAYIIAGGVDETSTSIVIRGYNTGVLPAAIYNVAGGIKTLFDSGTGFYMDDDGYFKVGSVSSNAKFNPSTGLFSVTGTINATSGNFINTVYIGNNGTASNNIQLIGSQTAASTAIGVGTGTLEYNTSNTKFWADASGRFSLGNNFTFNGNGITITGGSGSTSTFFNTTSSPSISASVTGSIGSNVLNAGSGVNFIASGFFIGMFVSGTGIQGATFIQSLTTTSMTLSEYLVDSCSSVTGYKYALSTGGLSLNDGLFAIDYAGNIKSTTGTFGRFKINEMGFSGDSNPLGWDLYGKTEILLNTETDLENGLYPGLIIKTTDPNSNLYQDSTISINKDGIGIWGFDSLTPASISVNGTYGISINPGTSMAGVGSFQVAGDNESLIVAHESSSAGPGDPIMPGEVSFIADALKITAAYDEYNPITGAITASHRKASVFLSDVTFSSGYSLVASGNLSVSGTLYSTGLSNSVSQISNSAGFTQSGIATFTNTLNSENIYSAITSTGGINFFGYTSSNSYAGEMIRLGARRAQTTAYDFITMYELYGVTGEDVQARISGSGRFSTDASSSTYNGADYAEFFEWEDGNINNEDRRGMVVVLNNNLKIEAYNQETHEESKIIGVVSSNPSIIGNSPLKWKEKYLKDEWGNEIIEDCPIIYWEEFDEETQKNVENWYYQDMIPSDIIVPENAIVKEFEEDGVTKITRAKINPEYDPEQEYLPREQRKEWAVIGLIGVVKVRKDQALKSNWIRTKEVSDNLVEVFIR